jgi:hypothetical protein
VCPADILSAPGATGRDPGHRERATDSFAAIRTGDAAVVERLLATDPTLAAARDPDRLTA